MTNPEYKQIRLNPEVRMQLDSYKMDGESYSIAIGRLFKENQSLMADKDNLMKMAMKTEDSIALPNVNHRTIFAIMEVLKMEGIPDADKVKNLKIYLRPSLEADSDAVFSCLQSFKEEYDEHDAILEELSSWIQESYNLGHKKS